MMHSRQFKSSAGWYLLFLLFSLFFCNSWAHGLRKSNDRILQSSTNEQLLEYPFRFVWRIDVDRSQDRIPNMLELRGVADATAEWLTDILADAPLPNALALHDVTAEVAASRWDFSRASHPHTISLDCQVTYRQTVTSTPALAIDIDMRSMLSDNIGSRDLSAFVTQYLRSSGPSSTVFRYSRSTATYVLQVTTFANGRPTQPPVTFEKVPVPLLVEDPRVETNTPTASPVNQPVHDDTAMDPSPETIIDNTPSETTIDNEPAETTINNTPAETIIENAPSEATIDNGVFWTTSVTLKFGGVDSGSDREPTPTELAALSDTTRELLQTSLETHYQTEDPTAGFAGVLSLEWTDTEFVPSSPDGLSHVLRGDIRIGYDEQVPTSWQDYYIFMLADIFRDNQMDYVLNHVRKSGPSDSIFRSVQRFSFDFRV